MSTITDHGGDVLRLAGDALIVAFTGRWHCRSLLFFDSTPTAVRPSKTVVWVKGAKDAGAPF